MDETGILEGQGSNGLVLGMSETKSVRKKQPGSRAWVSIIECISALGHALDPLIIYKGKTVQQQWFPLDLGPYEGWQFTATENGWTTDDTAVEWLQKVFIPQTIPQTASQGKEGQEGKEEARLLVVDGHGSHTTTDFMWLCYINNIHLLFLPPHTSHVLQPLDQSVFSPVKAAYRKELGYLSQWNDSTIVGKRNFIGCYQKARTAGMTMQNIRSGWKWTGLWPVSMAKPLMSSLLLPTTPKPSASSDQVSKGQSGGKEGKEAEGWASASSAVVWSTPRKMKDLAGQLKLFTELENDAFTQRLLFRKVKKGFSEQAYELATAQHKLELLQAQVTNTAARKRRTVQIDPNTKFANIEDIQKAQIEAGEKEDITDESSDSDTPSEAESYRFVSPIACADGHQICNPMNDRCTSFLGSAELSAAARSARLALNPTQVATLARIGPGIYTSTFYNLVWTRTQSFLQAQELVAGLSQLSLPSNQWQIEMGSLMADALASLQHETLEYVTGPAAPVQGTMLQPWDTLPNSSSVAADDIRAPMRDLCGSQRVRDTRGTLNFSVVGLSVLLGVGSTFIIISFFLEFLTRFFQQKTGWGTLKAKRWERDESLQVMRMLYELRDAGMWRGTTESFPTTETKDNFEFDEDYLG
ncbi:Tigger transposable element-derived protein 2 [Colletotrichum higginsianum]|uniref:Tigger transposable element-derived protein 2 n=2 Tax=Colletotrichum higginsianum TaxID=80884 RepID=A0A4T0VTG1_9PEZI|nr:Tigger transposable element-derived protein 2 [Colletotrichum higginsianum]